VEGLRRRLEAIGKDSGLDRVGFAGTEAFPEVELSMRQRLDNGMSARVGFTYSDPEIATTPRSSFPWGRTLVVGARAYLPEAGSPDLRQEPTEPSGRVSRVAAGDGYEPLRSALVTIASALRAEGHRAEVLCDDNRLVDRAAAVRAGLGWWGKNTMVLIPGIGPWAVIGSVMTDAELKTDEPLDRDCGACSACLPACPTGALVAPGVLDAERCLAAWAQRPGLVPSEYRVAMGDRLYGCDDCLVACPPGGKLLRRTLEPGGRFDLRSILHASDQTLLSRFAHWYIPNRDPEIVRRNALIAAGNSASRELIPQIALYAAHSDWVLRAHAAWALGRIGGEAAATVLDQRRSYELDVRVRAELP
jgi:epoxyqueuosine reductase